MSFEFNSKKLDTKFVVGSNIFSKGRLASSFFNSDKIIIFFPETIKNNHLLTLINYLKKNEIKFLLEEIIDEEIGKSLKNLTKIYEIMDRVKLNRDSLVIAFGGGTTSDLIGYAASTYLRGIKYGIIPTTILNQCDASIGGKCGINFKNLKNRIGNFYQPEWVITDITFTSTLTPLDFSSGLAEIYKIGLLSSNIYLNKIVNFIKNKDNMLLEEIIINAINFKINVVEEDIYDLNKKRVILNLGHTLGHALETISKNRFSHGECVAVGLLFSIYISNTLVEKEKIEKITYDSFKKLNLLNPLKLIQTNIDSLIEKMKTDKKNSSNSINYIILKKIGTPSIIRVNKKFLTNNLRSFSKKYI